jgi:NAD(P)-dependent dehydrogenase (short-subunit alcohol dehydrogenase family)
MELAGQVALVTGGGRGIGRGIALELTAAGARVAVAARTRGQVEETAAETGGIAIEADVSKRDDVERMVARAEAELGPLDLLVNNAGIGPGRTAWELEPEEWWRILEVNVLGVYLCCRTVIPGMIERGGGRIVNVASGAAYLPGSTSTAYSASKAAVHRFSGLPPARAARHPVFSISPNRAHGADRGRFGDDAPWTPPERRRDSSARSRRGASTRLGPLPPRRARRHRRRGAGPTRSWPRSQRHPARR